MQSASSVLFNIANVHQDPLDEETVKCDHTKERNLLLKTFVCV